MRVENGWGESRKGTLRREDEVRFDLEDEEGASQQKWQSATICFEMHLPRQFRDLPAHHLSHSSRRVTRQQPPQCISKHLQYWPLSCFQGVKVQMPDLRCEDRGWLQTTFTRFREFESANEKGLGGGGAHATFSGRLLCQIHGFIIIGCWRLVFLRSSCGRLSEWSWRLITMESDLRVVKRTF